jgi:hypothetical protein
VESDQKLPLLVDFLAREGGKKTIVYFLTCACVNFFWMARLLPAANLAFVLFSFSLLVPLALLVLRIMKTYSSCRSVYLCFSMSRRNSSKCLFVQFSSRAQALTQLPDLKGKVKLFSLHGKIPPKKRTGRPSLSLSENIYIYLLSYVQKSTTNSSMH